VKYAKRPPASTTNDRKQMAAMVQGLRLPTMAEPPAENLLKIAIPYYYTKKETSETPQLVTTYCRWSVTTNVL
jgi:hypothetical protein